MTTLPIAAASSPDRRSVSRTTAAPRSAAGIVLREPLKAPIAVRTGLQRTTSRARMGISFRLSLRCDRQSIDRPVTHHAGGVPQQARHRAPTVLADRLHQGLLCAAPLRLSVLDELEALLR